jgi:hypothetical protein
MTQCAPEHPTWQERWEQVDKELGITAEIRARRRERMREMLLHPIWYLKDRISFAPEGLSDEEREWGVSHMDQVRRVTFGLRRLSWLLALLAFIIAVFACGYHLRDAFLFGLLAAAATFILARIAIWVVEGFYFPVQ